MEKQKGIQQKLLKNLDIYMENAQLSLLHTVSKINSRIIN